MTTTMKRKLNQPKMEITEEEKMMDNKKMLETLKEIDNLFPDEEDDITPAPKKTKTTTKKTTKTKKNKTKEPKDTTKTKKEPKVKEPKVKEIKEKEVKDTNINVEEVKIIINTLPQVVQTKDLVSLFNFNDGGKFLRRHLRSKFQDSHEAKTGWVWDKTNDETVLIEIIAYFTDITNTKKELLTCVGDDVINGKGGK